MSLNHPRLPIRRLLPGMFCLFLMLLLLPAAPVAAADHSLGIGAEFWRTIDGFPNSDEINDIEDDGYALVVSYQYIPAGLFKFEVDVEIFEDGFGGSTDSAIAPEVFVLVGGFVYGGVGAGVTISDGLDDNVSDPFYMGRLGFQFSLLGTLALDVHATYRFDDWDALEDVDVSTDTFTLGAIARVRF